MIENTNGIMDIPQNEGGEGELQILRIDRMNDHLLHLTPMLPFQLLTRPWRCFSVRQV